MRRSRRQEHKQEYKARAMMVPCPKDGNAMKGSSSSMEFNPRTETKKDVMLKAFWKIPEPSNFYTIRFEEGVAWDEDNDEYCSCMSCKMALMNAAYINAQNRTSDVTAVSAYKNALGLD